MKVKLSKSITYFKDGKEVEIDTLYLDFDKLTGNDIFEVEREMTMMGHLIGTQFVQSSKALTMLGAKAADIPTFLVDTLPVKDVFNLGLYVRGFLAGLPIPSELQKELEGPQL